MKVLPIRYSRDVEAAGNFYRVLGLETGHSARSGNWVELPAAAGVLAIHTASEQDAGKCELAFETDESLDEVAARMKSAGYEPGPVIDENFGQSLRVCDPDGAWVQINRYDRSLYT